MVYNIMTCENLMSGGGFITACSMAWLAIALLFFIVIFLRKGLDLGGMEFNSMFGFIGCYLPFLIIVSLTGSAKWGLLGGIIGAVALGVGGSYIFGGDSSGGY